MTLSVADLKSIAVSGGGLVLDANYFTVADLKSIVVSAKTTQAQIIVKNPQKFSTSDLKSIAVSGGGCVVFDLYDIQK
jgi:hypothetical protein